ncbi:leucine-rich repeat flightless-interacting protein 2 isoform X3 [Myripristis murdjan]|uniref:leucine-rich repeat flightless-interacting protein 2 isoform X3 n=1 Tax=Myripristis murdjan TaxID=586833 RepID=UPI00117621FA|nr:leucine-rich repeat flightless-interacting protein 2-like isoform X3 [Myripristis murdjan]
MGTQGTGRKRNPNKERSTAEDDALNLIAREAEARLAAKRAARAEAREIRMKELERQQKELSDDDERMSVGSRGSVRVEDRDYLEKGSRAASALTAATLTSLGGTSSRRGSGETAITLDTEASIREIKEIHELKDQIQDVESKYTQNLKEIKDALVEVEEKYRKAMVSNAQLDNEKNNLMYQVDTLKDSLMELEELLSESRREYEEKVKEYEREKHAHSVLQFQFNEMKETLKQSEELLNEIRQLRMKQDSFTREISDLKETVEWKDKKIGALERQKEYTDAIRTERDELRDEVVKLKDILKKHGIVLGPDLNINGEVIEGETEGSSSGDPASRLAQDSQTSPMEGNSMLEIRLRKLVDEREKMIEQVKKLKAQLEQKTQRNGMESGSGADGEILENGTDPSILELQRDSNRQISDLKFKLVKAEQEVTALEQNVTRLEGQVTRYKSASENSEKVEDELKAEKRKLQRELRSALDKIDELESNNSHLSKRLEKMKSNRGTAQTP